MIYPKDFFDLSEQQHASLFDPEQPVWHALTRLNEYLTKLLDGKTRHILGKVSKYATLHGEDIYIGPETVVEDFATIVGPAYIGSGCDIRQGAFVRGQALMGDRCILGHASEIKHSIMLNDAKAPHFAYLGDSILGSNVNLGAGTKLSNLAVVSEKDKQTRRRPTIKLNINSEQFDTGLAKMGAIIGDDAQTGCNSVTNPGCLIGPRTLVYANTLVAKGLTPGDSILKLRQTQEIVPRQR